MRPVAFVLSAAFVLAAIAGQNSFFRPTQAETVTTPAIAACAQAGAAVQGSGCQQASLDSTPATVLSNTVLSGGCAYADLHIVRYVPAGGLSQRPLVATWCS